MSQIQDAGGLVSASHSLLFEYNEAAHDLASVGEKVQAACPKSTPTETPQPMPTSVAELTSRELKLSTRNFCRGHAKDVAAVGEELATRVEWTIIWDALKRAGWSEDQAHTLFEKVLDSC